MIAFVGFVFAAAVAQGPDPEAAKALSERARQLYDAASYSQAEPLYRQALEAWDLQGPEAALARAIDRRNLGAVLRATGRYREAEPVLLRSLRDLEASGAATMEIGRALFNLSALYRAQGNLPQAEAFALRAASLIDKSPDVPGAEQQAPRLILASVYLDQRRFNEAEAVLKATLENADGAIATAAYNGLAIAALARDDFAQAEEHARKALYFARLALPAAHPAVAAAWNNLAQACRFQAKYLEAEKYYRLAIDSWEQTIGPSHPTVAQGLMNLGSFYHERGREAGAEALYSRAAGILEQTFGKDDPRTLEARNELAEILRAERRYTEAEKLEKVTLAGLVKALRPDDPRLLRAQSNYARLQATRAH